MGELESYEKVEQLDVAGFLWSARKGPGEPVRYAIKFTPGAADDPAAAAKALALKTAADLQKKIAQARGAPGGGAGSWAAIQHIGPTPDGGAYYVSDFYPWSLRRAIKKHEHFTSPQLTRLSAKIAAAALDAPALYEHFHGNLKPGNVLLTSTDLNKADIALCDPAPPTSPESTDPTADRRGLGRIVYELVTGQTYQDYFWPLRPQKAWDALGEDGPKWLDRCNRLLAPAGDPAACTLEGFRKQLAPETLKPARSSSATGRVAGAAALIVAASAIGWWVIHKPSQLAVAPPPPSIAPVIAPAPAPRPLPPPIYVPPPASKPALAPAKVTPLPTAQANPDPVAAARQQQALQAAQLKAGDEMDKEVSAFADLAFEMQTTAPELHDVETDVQTARNIPVPSAASVDELTAKEKAAIASIRTLRRHAVDAALANAAKVSFKNPAISRSYASWLKTAPASSDAQTSLLKAVHVIHALRLLDGAWSASPVLPAGAAPVYDAQRDAALSKLIAAVAANPNGEGEKAGLADLQITLADLNQSAAVMASRFDWVAQVNTQLNKPDQPSAPPWQAMKDQLAKLPKPIPHWPDAPVPAAASSVDQVLATLAASDAGYLEKQSAAAGPPALLGAVCARWPTVHGEPDVDCQIFLNLRKGLGQVPPNVTTAVNALWLSRATMETDPARLGHLLELATKMGLPAKPQALTIAYYNARLAALTGAFKDQAPPAQAFLDQVLPLGGDASPLNDSDKRQLKKIAADLQSALNPAPVGGLPKNFRLASADSTDYLYTPPFDPQRPIRFKRVKNKSTGNAFFLATTEASMGWFSSLINDEKKGVVFRRLMDLTIPGKLAGPTPWRVNFIRGEIELNRDKSWLAYGNHNWDEDPSRYSPGGNGPTLFSPMQYVSPLAAMEAARLVGCRLPTVVEWQSAYESSLRDSDDNTSGGNWQRLRDSIDSLHPTPTNSLTWIKCKMELGIENANGRKLPFAGSVRSSDADVLWFRDVPADASGFHDMNGNVAQWVLASTPESPAPRLQSDDPITVVDETGTHVVSGQENPALAAFYAHCMRIGLTSTSGKDLEPEAAAIPADEQANHHHQYWDVGFRLAMDDPTAPAGPSLAVVVQRLKPLAN